MSSQVKLLNTFKSVRFTTNKRKEIFNILVLITRFLHEK